MDFTLVIMICSVSLAMAAPAAVNSAGKAEINLVEEMEITPSPKDGDTHPKLQFFQEQNYTIDRVLDILQQENEIKRRNHTSLHKKNERYMYS